MTNAITGEHVNFLLVFIEGLFSFFSPCVLPLLPIYISYLAGNAKHTGPDGIIAYERKRVFFHTLCFVLGVSASFFLLGLSFSAIGTFFASHRTLFSRIAGIIIILLGLFQIGFLDLKFLNREHRLPMRFKVQNMNPLVAFAMGFLFSFAWTPCVGPALSSVLILASSAKSALTGNLLVLVYALGFVLPFLALGLFTTETLNFLKKRQKFLKYTIKIGGILLVLLGVMTLTGWMNGISSYLTSFSGGSPGVGAGQSVSSSESTGTSPEAAGQDASEPDLTPLIDFTLEDQNGNLHTLSDYQGQVVFLNFWGTWCPPCKQEMPDIQKLYEKYGKNEGDVVFLGVAAPKTEENPYTNEGDAEYVRQFLSDNGYTFPVVFDTTGAVLNSYYISAFPTTFMIDRNGSIYGYVPGMMTEQMMESVIEQTLSSTDAS